MKPILRGLDADGRRDTIETYRRLGALNDALPSGVMGRATRTSNATAASSTYVDISGLSVTFTAVSGRLYKASWVLPRLQQATLTGDLTIALRNGSTVLGNMQQSGFGSTGYASNSGFGLYTGSGSVTLKMSYLTSAGTVTMQASATSPAHFVVEDVGLA